MPPTQLQRIAEGLRCTEAEAKAILADDLKIEKGEKLFELSQEQKAVEKKMRQADRKPTVYNFKPREKTANQDKRFLIEKLAGAVEEGESLDVVNPEREFNFVYKGIKYKVVLSCPRT